MVWHNFASVSYRRAEILGREKKKEARPTMLCVYRRLCRVRCYSFDPSVVSIGAVSERPIATVIVHTMVLDDYCVLTS